jgi:hypothetical protein
MAVVRPSKIDIYTLWGIEIRTSCLSRRCNRRSSSQNVLGYNPQMQPGLFRFILLLDLLFREFASESL